MQIFKTVFLGPIFPLRANQELIGPSDFFPTKELDGGQKALCLQPWGSKAAPGPLSRAQRACSGDSQGSAMAPHVVTASQSWGSSGAVAGSCPTWQCSAGDSWTAEAPGAFPVSRTRTEHMCLYTHHHPLTAAL